MTGLCNLLSERTLVDTVFTCVGRCVCHTQHFYFCQSDCHCVCSSFVWEKKEASERDKKNECLPVLTTFLVFICMRAHEQMSDLVRKSVWATSGTSPLEQKYHA